MPTVNVVDKLISSNYTIGRAGKPIQLLIFHTMDGFLTGTDAWFANPVSKVSAHEGIGLNGEVHRYVDVRNTAWAASNLDYNQRGINIEHEDNRHPLDVPRTDAMYESSAQRAAMYARQFNIPLDRSHFLHHHEVPGNSHPNCAGNLVVDRILARVKEILGGPAPVVVNPTTQPSHISIPTTRVAVVAGSANVRSLPSASDGSVVTSTLKTGQTFDVVGYLHTGVVINSDGYQGDLWVLSDRGHWVFGPLTSFDEAYFAPQPAVVATPDFVESPAHLRVVPAIGANLRTAPRTDQANVDHAVNMETTLAAIGYVTNGGNVNGNTKWWKTSDGFYVSDAVVVVITDQNVTQATLSAPPPEKIIAAPAPDVAPTPPVVPAPGDTTPPIVPAPAPIYDGLDTTTAGMYRANATVSVEDKSGQLPPTTLKEGQGVRIVGTWVDESNRYGRTAAGVKDGTAYAIPMSVLTKVLSSGPLVSDIVKAPGQPAPSTPDAQADHLTGRERVLAIIAAFANLLDKLKPWKRQ